MRKIYRWGIIGPGSIARKFAAALPLAGNAVLAAVASRDAAKARDFAMEFGAAKWYDRYERLAGDPDIDVIYVATPHAFHAEQVLLCLENCKPVLCEKPIALNYQQAHDMANSAKANKTFMMEAMWTRFLPVMEQMLELIKSGTIGTIYAVNADFGFKAPFDAKGRLFNPELGGGSLLDVGVYPLFLALLLLGEPQYISAIGRLSTTGVDESCRAVLEYGSGAEATIISAITYETSITAGISGRDGRIAIASPWYKTNRLTLTKHGKEPQTIVMEPVDNGFEYQIREVMHCLNNGLIESPKMPHVLSLSLAKNMDSIRKQIGVKYPGE